MKAYKKGVEQGKALGTMEQGTVYRVWKWLCDAGIPAELATPFCLGIEAGARVTA